MSKTDLREPPISSTRAPSRRKALSRGAVLSLILLLAAPSAAIFRLSYAVDYRILLGCWGAISALTYILYVRDKRKAQRDEWRTPELHLHLCELLGGWPAAFLAQRLIRHKISKTSYRWKFWSIVVLHQYAAADYLLDWRLVRGLLALLG